MNSHHLILDQLKTEIEDFYIELIEGKLDYFPELAKRLQQLADKAYDQVEELYPTPPSIKIEP
jgi:cell division septal protein FtsQ